MSSVQSELDTGQERRENGGVRIEVEDQVALAVEDLVALGRRVDELDVISSAPGTVTFRLGGEAWSVTVVPVDSAGLADARALTDPPPDAAQVVVGNKISEEARSHLTAVGWSWFDRRVGAHIVRGDRTFDIRFVPDELRRDDAPPANAGPVRTDGPIRGRAGISYAAALLLHPEAPPTMRAVAREVHMSPTAISNAAKLLAVQGLVVDARPSIPELFWALADVWRPVKIASVATGPDPSAPQLTVNADDLDQPGWARAGDAAALELGAPVFTTDDRPWFWVPSQTEARRAQRVLGPAEPSQRAATVAVPPTALVVTRRIPAEPWPLAHPLFIALELARDPGRGREILEQWHPEGVARVWG